MLGDLIDLAQDNSVRWPVPHALPLADPNGATPPAPRRHYLRVTGSRTRASSATSRVSCAGRLDVQNRATRDEENRTHLAFMISPSSDSSIASVRDGVAQLARVDECLCLGVLE